MVIWIIGKTGSGKTLFGKQIYKKLSLKKRCFLLDGDDIRYYLNNDLGFSLNDRKINSLRIQKLCNFLEIKGFVVICCIQSLFKTHQKKNINLFKKYLQIYIKVTNQVMYNKKFKFKKKKKNIVGKDILFPEPYKSDIILLNDYSDKTKKINFLLKKIKQKL